MRAESLRKTFPPPGNFKMPIGDGAKADEARQAMAAPLLEFECEDTEVVRNTAAGRRGIITDIELDMLLG